ncbi:hypothetical protein [Rubinisphaera italica]|nr:hypothetical protein [Rubinisphaera italica]
MIRRVKSEAQIKQKFDEIEEYFVVWLQTICDSVVRKNGVQDSVRLGA